MIACWCSPTRQQWRARRAHPEQVQLGELTGPVKQPSSLGPTQSELDRADDSTSDWLMYNKGYEGQRLEARPAQRRTVTKLGRYVCSNSASSAPPDRPVVYDGVVYATTPPEHLRNRRNQLPKAVEPSAHCARTGR